METLLVLLVIVVVPKDGYDRHQDFGQLFDDYFDLGNPAVIGKIAAEDQDIGMRIDVGESISEDLRTALVAVQVPDRGYPQRSALRQLAQVFRAPPGLKISGFLTRAWWRQVSDGSE